MSLGKIFTPNRGEAVKSGFREVIVLEAKYHMTREENIFVAKRNIVDYIWKSARLEGLAVTYPDTEAIYNGMSVQGGKGIRHCGGEQSETRMAVCAGYPGLLCGLFVCL